MQGSKIQKICLVIRQTIKHATGLAGRVTESDDVDEVDEDGDDGGDERRNGIDGGRDGL
jgi:hypothetical protein